LHRAVAPQAPTRCIWITGASLPGGRRGIDIRAIGPGIAVEAHVVVEAQRRLRAPRPPTLDPADYAPRP
jgi:hypothetical protein